MPGLVNAADAIHASGTGGNDPTGSSYDTMGTTDGNGATSSVADNPNTSADAGANVTPSANGKDENGNPPTYRPKTGDRRYYSAIVAAIIAAGTLFLAILLTGRRKS